MITVFGEEIMKPVRKYGFLIPEYFVTRDAKVYSEKTKRYLTDCAANKKSPYRKISLNIPIGHFSDDSYPYYEDNNTCSRHSFDLHRIVMEAWKPIDEYPPDEINDEWFEVITPDMVGQPRIPPKTRQWVRDTALIDHKDNNPENNNIENLRYTTPRGNNCYRKEYESAQIH